MATPLRKQDGGLCYVLRDTLGESAWDSGIYKKSRPVSHVIAIRPPAYQAYCGGTVNWSLSQGVVGEPSLLLSPVAAVIQRCQLFLSVWSNLATQSPFYVTLKMDSSSKTMSYI